MKEFATGALAGFGLVFGACLAALVAWPIGMFLAELPTILPKPVTDRMAQPQTSRGEDRRRPRWVPEGGQLVALVGLVGLFQPLQIFRRHRLAREHWRYEPPYPHEPHFLGVGRAIERRLRRHNRRYRRYCDAHPPPQRSDAPSTSAWWKETDAWRDSLHAWEDIPWWRRPKP